VYNLFMQKILSCFFLFLIMTSCSGTKETVTATVPALPYQIIRSTDTATLLSPLAEILLPTPTTFTYIVQAGDSLTSIAVKYGITLEALQAANPGVQSSSLPLGTKLFIPSTNEIPREPTPIPAPLSILQAHCWTENDGSLWCFALFQNNYSETIENLSAQFSLLDSDGQEITSQKACALLDILPAGRSIALGVHFPQPLQNQPAVRVQVLTSIRLLPGDVRYLSTEIENTLIEQGPTGWEAKVSGNVILTSEGTAKVLWVLAIAYDKAGQVVGIRRWDSPSTLNTNNPVPFTFSVYSVGVKIDRVELLAEAKP
jgi:LysM repeat protein